VCVCVDKKWELPIDRAGGLLGLARAESDKTARGRDGGSSSRKQTAHLPGLSSSILRPGCFLHRTPRLGAVRDTLARWDQGHVVAIGQQPSPRTQT
jgi:hypothetical protein